MDISLNFFENDIFKKVRKFEKNLNVFGKKTCEKNFCLRPQPILTKGHYRIVVYKLSQTK